MAGYAGHDRKRSSYSAVPNTDNIALPATLAKDARLGLPQLTGWLGLMCAIGAVALPTAIRAAIDGVVTGCEFTPYLPFVLLAAILIGWWQAGLVALASVAVLGGLFIGSPSHFLASTCARSSVAIFLASSAIIIFAVTMVRHLIVELQRRWADHDVDGIIFSLDKGEVWASWNGSGEAMHLGSRERVEAMMEDFLAQGELGNRLARKCDPGSL